MYEYLEGILVSKRCNIITKGLIDVVIDVNSVGYNIIGPLRIFDEVSVGIGSKIRIYTTLIHRDDVMNLCGFLDRRDRDIFNILQTVSGVGVKSGLLLLNEFSSSDFIINVINENEKTLCKTKGVGSKLAKKIIIELKDKLLNLRDNFDIENEVVTDCSNEFFGKDIVNEVSAVLMSLGYLEEEIKSAIGKCIVNIDVNSDMESEELLKLTLEYLARM